MLLRIVGVAPLVTRTPLSLLRVPKNELLMCVPRRIHNRLGSIRHVTNDGDTTSRVIVEDVVDEHRYRRSDRWS